MTVVSGALTIGQEDTTRFETQRRRLQGVAYRMLGSVSDAEDVVQEGWLRWFGLGEHGRATVTNPAAWMTTVVSRLALDRLKSAHHQREMYVGPWLPEPVIESAGPEETAELAETLTVGFLTMLELLGPVERAVFLLVDVFGEPFATVAQVVGRSEAACRQVASRARRRVRAAETDRGSARRQCDLADQRLHADQLVGAFLGACAAGDLETLHELLADDVVVLSDGGALVHAARRPVVGVERAGRFLINLAKRLPAAAALELCEVNRRPGVVLWDGQKAAIVIGFEFGHDRIAQINIVVNPDKLGHLVRIDEKLISANFDEKPISANFD